MADVLIVDDDADLAEMVALVIASRGHAVRSALDGASGFAALRARVPDVIVLDVEMPFVSGPELAFQMVVRDAGLEQVPIVLVSGVVDFDAVVKRVGTPYALTKPFSATQLLATVERALRERRPPAPCSVA